MKHRLALLACLAAGAAAAPAHADTLTFGFEGRCIQACGLAGLGLGGAVGGTLQVDSALMPAADGEVARVFNSQLLGLDVNFGSQHFGLGDVLPGNETLFQRAGEGAWFIANGSNPLAYNGRFELIVSPAALNYPPPYVSLFLYEGVAAALGVFASGPVAVPPPPVPEPGAAALLAAGLAALALRRRARR